MGELAPITKIIPVLVVTAFMVIGMMLHQTARQKQILGVLWLQAMRRLITHLQRHRGLSAGVLGGEQALEENLSEVRKQVFKDIDAINGVGEWMNQHADWLSIVEHWTRLIGSVHRLSVSDAIHQHTLLIKNVLALVDEIAVEHHLHDVPGGSQWRDLLTLAEYVGQMRALGTAIATVANHQDEIAVNKTREDLQGLSQEILTSLDSPNYRAGIDGDNLQRILDFLSYVDAQLLKDAPGVEASGFYAEATKTLDQLFKRFDQQLSQVHQRLAH